MKESLKNSKRIGLLALLAMGIPALGLAAAPNLALEEVQMKVYFADLDLNHGAGVERLYQRIRSAASKACGPATLREAGSLQASRASQACYRELLDEAVVKVNNASLTKRHFG